MCKIKEIDSVFFVGILSWVFKVDIRYFVFLVVILN